MHIYVCIYVCMHIYLYLQIYDSELYYTYKLYNKICVCVCVSYIKDFWMNQWEVYMGEIRGRKEKGEICNYILIYRKV